MSLYGNPPMGALSSGFVDPLAGDEEAQAERAKRMFDMTIGRKNTPFPSVFGDMQQDPLSVGSIGDIGVPDVPKVKQPGFLGRIRQQPGGSRALLAFGASLLSNPDFFQGLGQGALAYQGVLDEEKDKLKPKLTKDSTFTYSIDPTTGEPVFKRTPVADFEDDQLTKKLQANLAGVGIREEGDTKRLETTLGFKDKWWEGDDAYKRWRTEQEGGWKADDNKTDLEIARINAATNLEKARMGGENKQTPAGIQKQIGDYTTVRDGLDNATSQIEPILQAIQNGDLTFSLPNNLRHKAAIATGIGGNKETVLYSQFQTTLESLRNALLIANKGVQTDGDADRAMAELIAGQGDQASIQANLMKVVDSLRKRSSQAQARIDDLAGQYNANVSNSSPGSPAAAPRRQAPTTGRTSSGTKWRIVQ